MPPKDKKAEKGQQKAEEKQKARVAEDKTFGLKNKNKSKAVQKYIKGVKQQVTGGPKKGGESAQVAAEYQAKELKKKEQQQQALLAALYGASEKVKKASREDQIRAQKQAAKLSLYVDRRSISEKDVINMTQEELEAFFDEKARTLASGQAYDITCKYFIDACEKSQYGWFWECPNGGDTCKYRHALPLDYVLKKDSEPAPVFDEDGEPLEEKIEAQRQELVGGTPVTEESFKEWKRRRAEIAAASRKDQPLSGKDLFTENPDLFEDDEDEPENPDLFEDDEDEPENPDLYEDDEDEPDLEDFDSESDDGDQEEDGRNEEGNESAEDKNEEENGEENGEENDSKDEDFCQDKKTCQEE